MTVRPAVENDVEQILAMLGRFHAAAGMAEYAAIEPATLHRTVTGFMGAELAHVLVSGPQGAIAGTACVYCLPVWFNNMVLEASELWWWVDPVKRGGVDGVRLLRAMETWARGKGALTMQIGTVDALTPKGRNVAYERLGYQPKDRHYIARI